MNKKEAANFLGVNVRALERYVQQGRVSVRYEKGKTRPTANFAITKKLQDDAQLQGYYRLLRKLFRSAISRRHQQSYRDRVSITISHFM